LPSSSRYVFSHKHAVSKRQTILNLKLHSQHYSQKNTLTTHTST